MSLCFNKVTWVWQEVADPNTLTPTTDWIVDPVYSDYNACIAVGPAHWIYSGNTISPDTAVNISNADLIDAKNDMWEKIKNERDRRKAGGVQVGTDWFHSDDNSRIQQLGLVMFGTNMPSNIMWKTMTGTFVQMTPTLASQIFSAVASSDMTIFAVAEQHRTNMEASSDPTSYNYLTGWPLIFGE